MTDSAVDDLAKRLHKLKQYEAERRKGTIGESGCSAVTPHASEDKELQARLARLRGGNQSTNASSDEDLRKRLATLKGSPSPQHVNTATPPLCPPLHGDDVAELLSELQDCLMEDTRHRGHDEDKERGLDALLLQRATQLRDGSSTSSLRPSWLTVYTPKAPKTGDTEVDDLLAQVIDDIRTDTS